MKPIPKEVETLGDALRWARERARLTLRGLAERVGVSAPFLSDVEHNRRRLADDTLVALARELDVSPSEFRSRGWSSRALTEFLRAHPKVGELLARERARCRCPHCVVFGRPTR